MQPTFDINRAQQATSAEPFFQQYQPHLGPINLIVMRSGELMEGNMMYPDRTTPIAPPDRGFLPRRQNMCMLAMSHNVLVEIGFNAGHSALLALTANPDLHYYGIDIGSHSYTRPCFEYLRGVFGDRITLMIGDSVEVMPDAMPDLTQREEFRAGGTAWCIDGGHNIVPALADMTNVLRFAKDGDVLLFDDSEIPQLANLLDFYVVRGDLVPIKSSPSQEMYRIMKRMPA